VLDLVDGRRAASPVGLPLALDHVLGNMAQVLEDVDRSLAQLLDERIELL
jgi:hypothetical protein